MSDIRLDLNSVCKSFDGLAVLDRISLQVRRGEFVSILGPSGAGKSTLLRLLTGGVAWDSGEIRFDGGALAGTSPFAFMPQRDALMPWRRIIDNTTLGLEVQGASRHTARERVAPLFAEFGLAGFEQHFPSQLSGGMRQRAALLRTVVQDRPMLLLDEPFGALDAITRTAMQRWLMTMWAQHLWTALLITHDVREAVFLSDRIYALSSRPARVLREFVVPTARSCRRLASPEASRIEAEILDTLLSQQPDL
jgi:ABC-type nitrate/sulfonate/bicarbonate transport system ATPase subunit